MPSSRQEGDPKCPKWRSSALGSNQKKRVQAAEICFLDRVAVLSFRDWLRSSAIREEVGVEPLLLHIERSQMRWLGNSLRIRPGCLPAEAYSVPPCGMRPPERPRTCWRDYVSRLALENLRIPPEQLRLWL